MSIITRSGFFKRGYNLAPTAPSGGFYPNKPIGYLNSSELDFSQSVPAGAAGSDIAIPGTDWYVWASGTGNPFSSYWTKTLDATAPQTPPSTWVGNWVPGTFATGHGIGNVFTYGPSNIFLTSPITQLYFSTRLYYEFPNTTYWQPVSNKFINITGNHSQILVQLNEGGKWRHCEELGYGDPYYNFAIDNSISNPPTEITYPGLLSNGVVPINQWLQIEMQIDLPNRIFKVWQDGVLTTNGAPIFASTSINTIGINAHRGGGGETLDANLYFHYDHFYIAW